MTIQLPEYFHLAQAPHLTRIVSDMLLKLVQHNDKIPVTNSNLTRFHSRAAPSISIQDYMERIIKYAGIERVSLLMILIYIDRICQRNPDFTISSLTVHRFIIAAVTCASKAFCDTFLTNSAYAKVGGVTTRELNVLEIEFLYFIDWQLSCSVDLLQSYYVNLVRQHPAFVLETSSSPVSSPLVLPQEGRVKSEATLHSGTHSQENLNQQKVTETSKGSPRRTDGTFQKESNVTMMEEDSKRADHHQPPPLRSSGDAHWVD